MNNKKCLQSFVKPVVLVTAASISLLGCGGSNSNGSKSSSSLMASSAPSVSSVMTSSLAQSSAPANDWQLVWSDEFDAAQIDSTKWSFEKNCTGGGNNELQCYTERATNAYVSDGRLHIVARKEPFSGQSKGDDDPAYDVSDTSISRDYTSARLRTKNKGDWTYGRIEVSAKMPQGQGIWPAIWMLPTEWKYGAWPLSGEIDIFEAVNTNTAAGGNDVHGTLHYGRMWPNNVYTGTSYVPEKPIWENFHRYSVEWEAGEIRWYIDDHHFATQTQEGWFTYYWGGQTKGYKVGEGAAPFDQAFHLILNLAVGGNWPGNPNEQTQFPQQMDVEYVRVYECAKDKVTGKGCASNVNPEIQPLQGVTKPEQKSFSLFNNGAASFNFTVNDKVITNSLLPAFYDGGTAGNVVSTPNYTQADKTVWDIMFNGAPGNTFLMTGDMSAETAVDNGFKFTNMQSTGEFSFDLYVDAIESATKLLIKLDSGWPNLSYSELTNLKVGEWQHVSVPFENLKANNIQAGEVNYDAVLNPFVVEPSGGTAHIKINNLAVKCLGDCAINPVIKGVNATLTETFDVFVDAVDANWDFGIGEWQTGGDHIDIAVIDAEDTTRGKVIDITFKTADQNGVAFIQSTSTKDARAFAATGYLEFDLKVLSYGANTSGLVVKADCVNPCSSGDIALGKVADGVWQTIRVPAATMVTGGLNLAKLNTPFVILPTWGEQQNVHFQLDNIRWVKPE